MDRVRLGWRVSACLAVVAALITDCIMAEVLLSAPPGAFLYFPAAFILTLVAYNVALYAFGETRSLLFAMVAEVVIVILAVWSVWQIPWIVGRAEWFLYHRDPVGVDDDVAKGPCHTREVVVLPNGRGLVADLRETYCSGNWDGDLMYFVFVRPANEANARQNLVFRYSADTLPDVRPPGVTWIGAQTLRVVARGVLDISEQTSTRFGATIRYDVRYEFPQ